MARVKSLVLHDSEGISGGFHYTIEAIQLHSDIILSAVEGDDIPVSGKKSEEAKNFLYRVLARGPVPVAHVKAQARAEGIASVTPQRVKEAMNIRSTKKQRRVSWQLGLVACSSRRSASGLAEVTVRYPISYVINRSRARSRISLHVDGHNDKDHDALSYRIVVSWIIAEHKSQGLLQIMYNKDASEYVWIDPTSSPNADAKSAVLFNLIEPAPSRTISQTVEHRAK